MSNQKIIPHLWFDHQAREAVQFYTSIFPSSEVTRISRIFDTPSGDSDIFSFHISGYEMVAINGGPYFQFTPSISFMVNFDPSQIEHAQQQLDQLWNKLSQGGTPLMPLQEYPFSKRYGWIQDTYGLTWQLILTDPAEEPRPFIIPSLMFTQAMCGKAEEASSRYLSVFHRSRRGQIARYPAGMEPDREGTLQFTDFMLENQWFAAMDSAQAHTFSFNEAVSFLISCENQAEIDYFWSRLSADPQAEQCGWLKDAYGVSWQVVPTALQEMIEQGTRAQKDRLTKAFLNMKKLDLAVLHAAFSEKL